MEFNYSETYNIMRKFWEFGKIEVLIIDELMKVDYLECNISGLAKIINKDVSNTKKALKKLEEKGLVYLVKGAHKKSVKAIFLVDGWLHILNGDWQHGCCWY